MTLVPVGQMAVTGAMNDRRLLNLLLAIGISAAACSSSPATGTHDPTGIPDASSSLPPMTLFDTGARPFEVVDFAAVHRPVDAGGNASLIFGALPVTPVATGTAPEVAAFLGRWEGYGDGPPIKRDWRYVVAVTTITPRDGTAFIWAGTNTQFPSRIEQVHFRVTGQGAGTAIEWDQTVGGTYAVVSVRHAPNMEALEGTATPGGATAPGETVLLRRDATEGIVYRDYPRHLADLGITWQPHDDVGLTAAGAGSLVYLPQGYDADPGRRWPLILFLHGAGDRRDSGYFIAQNSPFRFVTAGRPLDAIVVAPLLAGGMPTFPTTYLEGSLDEALARYPVDPDRVTLSGLSMGGEAAYRLARHRPGTFAGVSVLAGFDAAAFPASVGWGYEPIPDPASALARVPVLAIHGRDDTVVPLTAAQGTVDALVAAGVDVTFSILDGHDHDVWSTTYADPAYFDWLLAQRRVAP
jgi:predicted esterase